MNFLIVSAVEKRIVCVNQTLIFCGGSSPNDVVYGAFTFREYHINSRSLGRVQINDRVRLR